MRPISRWAFLGLAAMPGAGEAAPDIWVAPPPATMAAVTIVSGLTDPSWLGLRARPFSISRLIGRPPADADETSRSRNLGAAPEPPRLISFARGTVDAQPSPLLLRNAPRFSRMPGKQVQDFEAGLRSRIAEDQILLQIGVSYDMFRNLQTTIRQGSRLMTASAGKAKTYGVEGLARWSPERHVSLFATYGWREGRLKNRVRDGRKFRLSPDRSAAIGAVLTMPAGRGRIAFTPSVAWRSAMGIGADIDGRGSGAVISAQFGYGLSDGFEVEAVAANLLNRPAARSTTESTPLIAGEPRVLGVRARLRFGRGG